MDLTSVGLTPPTYMELKNEKIVRYVFYFMFASWEYFNYFFFFYFLGIPSKLTAFHSSKLTATIGLL